MSDTGPDRANDEELDLPPRRGMVLPDIDELTRSQEAQEVHEDELDGPEDLAETDDNEENLTRGGLPRVAWPESDADAPDFAHLEPEGREPKIGDEDFEIGAAELNLLIKANQFIPEGFDDRFVFALRGAKLQDGDAAEGVTRIALKETRPNHREFMCTIGFYSPATGKLTGFKASTVPNVKFMTNYYKKINNIRPHSSTGANMLPAGCYVYRVGAHGGGRIRPALRLTNPDKLTQDGTVTTLRTHNDLTFRYNDLWDKCTPYDNIHCAYSYDKFSSAGCLTICGPNRKGPWGKFQAVLKTMRYNARHDVVLLTSREASIAAYIVQAGKQDDADFVRSYLGRLRHGSQGAAVKRLQEKLGGGVTGYFGPSTKLRLTKLQAEKNLRPDGIYSDALDTALGWDVMKAWSLEDEAPPEEPAVASTADPSAGALSATVGAAAATSAGAAAAAAATAVAQPEPVPQPQPVAQPRPQPAPTSATPIAPAESVTPAAPSIITRPRLAFTPQQIKRFAPRAKSVYVDALINNGELLSKYGVDQHPMRFCHFLGQIGNECGRLRILEENMNYTSARRLQAVWPSRFPTRRSAEPYVRNAEKLANNVYGGRLGNTEPGDGWRYRGRGFVQTTGRGGYREMGKKLGIPLEDNPDLAFDPRYALAIACETWASKKLKGERGMNDLAELNKLEAMTYRINGGYTNIDDRRAAFEEAWAIWAEDKPPKGEINKGILERGDRGAEVRTLNDQLARIGMFDGITRRKPRSVYNYYTYRAVRAFHKKEGDEEIGFVADDTAEKIDEALSRVSRSRGMGRRSPESLPRSEDTVSERVKSRLSIIRTSAILLAVLSVAYALLQFLTFDGTSTLGPWAPAGSLAFATIVFLFALALWIAAAPLSRATTTRSPAATRSAASSEEPEIFFDMQEEPVRNGLNLEGSD